MKDYDAGHISFRVSSGRRVRSFSISQMLAEGSDTGSWSIKPTRPINREVMDHGKKATAEACMTAGAAFWEIRGLKSITIVSPLHSV